MKIFWAVRSWIELRFASILTWGIVGTSFVAGYIAFLRTWSFFFNDARYYMAMAMWFSGDSQAEARRRTIEFVTPFEIQVPELEKLFGWGLVQPRVVFPAIAAPFVKLIGPYGVHVTAFLITVALTILITIVLIRRFGNTAAVATMLLVNGSASLMRFNTSPLTESLSALWTLILLLVAWHYIRQPRWSLLLVLAGVTALSAFTRQATLIVAGAFILAWILGSLVSRRNSRWMLPALMVTATSLLCQILQTILYSPFSQVDQFVSQSGADTLSGAMLAVPAKAVEILKADFLRFMHTDQPLMFIVILSVIGMIVFWRREESHLLFGAILGVALYNITNGTPTVFRYAIPGLAFYLIVIALLISQTREAIAPQLPPLPTGPSCPRNEKSAVA